MNQLQIIRDRVVLPALLAINAYSLAAEQLVMATGMVESLYRHTRQIAKYRPDGGIIYGPARGYWQMEPATHNDLWGRWLGPSRRAPILDGLRKISHAPGDIDELENNQTYAAAMCRIKYLSIREGLPEANDFDGMARYWKKYYNTPLGKGTVEGFMHKAAPVFALYPNHHPSTT